MSPHPMQLGSRAPTVRLTARRSIVALPLRQTECHPATAGLLFALFHSVAREYHRTVYLPPTRMMKEHTRELLISEIVSRVFSFEGWGCKISYIEENRPTSGSSCKACLRRLISPRRCKLSYTHLERSISHEDNLTEGQLVAHYGQ